MKLPFHLVIEYAEHTNPNLVQSAFDQFFSETGFPQEQQQKDAFPLFSEWLIYDFRTRNKSTFLTEYFLKDPDRLPKSTLRQIEQVIKTHWYGGFQVLSIRKGESMELEHLFSGKKVIVYDKLGSRNLSDKGTIVCRLAKVDKRWYIVGSNPLYLPQTFTPRMRKISRRNKIVAYSSPQHAWELLKKITEPTPPAPKITYKEILKKRKDIENKYRDISKNVESCMSFSRLIHLIYEEDGRSPLDWWSEIMKSGLPNELFIEYTELFNDVWNYFPHKILNDECPIALFNKLSKTAK